MLDEGVATATIDEAAKQAFGIGMGPFEPANVTAFPSRCRRRWAGVRTLYEPPGGAGRSRGKDWTVSEHPTREIGLVGERLSAAVFYVASALVDEKAGRSRTPTLARAWGCAMRGPFEMMNTAGSRAPAISSALRGALEGAGAGNPSRRLDSGRRSRSGWCARNGRRHLHDHDRPAGCHERAQRGGRQFWQRSQQPTPTTR